MFDTATIDQLNASATLDLVADNVRQVNLLEAQTLAAACRWADLNAFVADESSLPGTERLIQLGGTGTPLVAEFAPAELAGVLAMSPYAASALIGDALDLRHRHRELWTRVQAGEVKSWIARRIVQITRQLTADLAGQIDRTVARYADRKSVGELETLCVAEAIRLDPDTARVLAASARKTHGVWVAPSIDAGTKEMLIRADAADVLRFDAAVDRTADDLALLGDTDDQDQRRARAVGILARPQLALDFRTQAIAVDAGQPSPETPTARGPFGTATLYLHLTDHTLATGDGVARVEGIGPVLASQIRDWLRHDNVIVKSVIDLNRQAPVDGYEVPDRLREAVHLAMPTDCFPFATNKTRRKDIDHTIAFDAPSPTGSGPPGQTAMGNLAPLTRFHHRVKTHSDWQVRQPFPGIHLWRSPHGRHYLVDHTGTRALPA